MNAMVWSQEEVGAGSTTGSSAHTGTHSLSMSGPSASARWKGATASTLRVASVGFITGNSTARHKPPATKMQESRHPEGWRLSVRSASGAECLIEVLLHRPEQPPRHEAGDLLQPDPGDL